MSLDALTGVWVMYATAVFVCSTPPGVTEGTSSARMANRSEVSRPQ